MSEMDKIVRERQTTERIQAFDRAEIVDEIHALQDAFEKWRNRAVTLYTEKVNWLTDNAALQAVVEAAEILHSTHKAGFAIHCFHGITGNGMSTNSNVCHVCTAVKALKETDDEI